MKGIRDLKSTQIRIFPIDEIGFNSLQRSNAKKQIQEKYKLQPSTQMFFESVPGESHKMTFVNGEFFYEGEMVLIDRLSIEERRIIICMSSSSNMVSLMFEDLRKLLIDLDLRDTKSNYKPIVIAQETSCVAKLDFSFTDLFKNTVIADFNSYISKNIKLHGCETEIIPSAIRFKICYIKQPESFIKHKITLSEKDFILEIRDRTAYEDNLYYTFSPTDSETHIKLLIELEKRLVIK